MRECGLYMGGWTDAFGDGPITLVLAWLIGESGESNRGVGERGREEKGEREGDREQGKGEKGEE